MRLNTTAIGLAAALGLVGLAALPAQAAPINSPRVTGTLSGYCTGYGPVSIVSPPANGQFTPGFIVGTHAVAVPYSFDFVLSANGQVIDEQLVSKKAVPKDAQLCTITLGSFTDDQGVTYTYTGDVVVEIHGQPQS